MVGNEGAYFLFLYFGIPHDLCGFFNGLCVCFK
nr:MAG TPA: hypothetical protein [Caudoviricetes sp.]